MIKTIKKIKLYFKNDYELIGKCYYCGKSVKYGRLFIKKEYGYDILSNKSKYINILICNKPDCYSNVKKDYSVSALSKKQILYYDLMFFIIFMLSIATLFFKLM